MKIGFVVYQGMNLLEFALLYDPLTRIKTMGFDEGLSWDLVSYTLLGGDDRGLELKPTRVGGHLREYDIPVSYTHLDVYKRQSSSSPVRLACVKHAASVRPEPGSNSSI